MELDTFSIGLDLHEIGMKSRCRPIPVAAAASSLQQTADYDFAPSSNPQRASADAATYPTASWDTIPASSLSNACKRDLDAARDYLRTLDSTALMAVQDGRVLFTYGDVKTVSIVFSARKSVLSMMYGKYVANGTIDLDRSLADLGIDDIGGLLPIERHARLRDLLSARSGVYHAAANGGDDSAFAPARGSQQPGSYVLYNNRDFNAAGTAFELGCELGHAEELSARGPHDCGCAVSLTPSTQDAAAFAHARTHAKAKAPDSKVTYVAQRRVGVVMDTHICNA